MSSLDYIRTKNTDVRPQTTPGEIQHFNNQISWHDHSGDPRPDQDTSLVPSNPNRLRVEKLTVDTSKTTTPLRNTPITDMILRQPITTQNVDIVLPLLTGRYQNDKLPKK